MDFNSNGSPLIYIKEKVSAKRVGTYESDLFGDVDSVDVLITVLRERAVRHHGVLGASVLIINRDNHRVVVLDGLAELEGRQIVRIKLDRSALDQLITSSVHLQVLDVVFAVRSVEHLGRVVGVLLFSYTHVDTDVRVAQSIILEGYVEFVAFSDFL